MLKIGQPRETKDRRVSLVLRPSVVSRIQKIVAVRGENFNNFMDQMLEEYARQHDDEVRMYDRRSKVVSLTDEG